MPLLLAAYETFHERKRECFTSILRYLFVTSLRYNVICNQPPNEQEILYNAIATEIMAGKLTNGSEVKKALLRLCPGDSLFREAFASKAFNTSSGRNRNLVRYLLASIGQHMHGTPLDATDVTLGIEHILPEHPDESWAHMDERKQEDLRYRLGNMILLENPLNRDIGNADFTTKKLAYARSACPDAKSIAASFNIWDENAIVKRQSQLAKAACAIWRID